MAFLGTQFNCFMRANGQWRPGMATSLSPATNKAINELASAKRSAWMARTEQRLSTLRNHVAATPGHLLLPLSMVAVVSATATKFLFAL